METPNTLTNRKRIEGIIDTRPDDSEPGEQMGHFQDSKKYFARLPVDNLGPIKAESAQGREVEGFQALPDVEKRKPLQGDWVTSDRDKAIGGIAFILSKSSLADENVSHFSALIVGAIERGEIPGIGFIHKLENQ